MAKTWNKGEWEDELIRIATAAADDHMSKIPTEGYSKETIEAIRKERIRTGVAELKKNFGFSLSDKDKNTVSNWDVKDASSYLFSGGNKLAKDSHNPILKKRMDDFAKLSPLVQGIADEGRDWYSMGAVDLLDTGKKLGYNTKSKEGRMDFLRDVGDVQTAYDRGKLLEEFDEKSSILSDLFYPTLMEEARKQIATGREEPTLNNERFLDTAARAVTLPGRVFGSGIETPTGTLRDAMLLDLLVNGMIGTAPVFSLLGKSMKASSALAAKRKSKSLQALFNNRLKAKAADIIDEPIISGGIGAAIQSGVEAERQLVKEHHIDPDLEADYGNALLAFMLGITRPAMIGSASGMIGQLPGEGPSNFAAGISAATRRGNPVYAERQALSDAFDTYNRLFNKSKNRTPLSKNFKKATKEHEEYVKNSTPQEVSLVDINANKTAEELEGKVNAIYAVSEEPATSGSSGKAKRILDEGLKDEFLADYDNLANMRITRIPREHFRRQFEGVEIVNGENRPVNYLETLARLFPAKMREAYGNNKAYRTGLHAGELLGALGGSIEPILKVNPLGPLTGGAWNLSGTDYKETPWYKRMTKRQREAFDAAYERTKKSKESYE